MSIQIERLWQQYRGDGTTTLQLKGIKEERPVLYVCPHYGAIDHTIHLALKLGVVNNVRGSRAEADGVFFVAPIDITSQRLRGVRWKQIIVDHHTVLDEE